MKTISTYILEGMTAQDRFFCETFVSLYTDCKLTKEQIKPMLDNLNMKLLQSLSDFFNETDATNYMTYEPSSDVFAVDSNKDKITTQLAEYISKFIAQ